MYDLSDELMTFYNNHVKLEQNKIDELFEKKNTNINKLKDGLVKYNEKNDTAYLLKESYVQGSVAMNTVIQAEENDYDIDVGILLDEPNIEDAGSRQVKNVVLNSFELTGQLFSTPPEVLTNCVRFTYSKGYQIDFAVYRDIYTMEHSGSKWRERDPEAINTWFNNKVQIKGNSLTKTIQLIKMFNKSRSGWKMPGGLITTILVEEALATEHSRIDLVLYYTIENIVNRLKRNEDIKSPIYPFDTILYVNSSKKTIKTFRNRLESYLDKLSVLNEYDCTKTEAIKAWQSFFNHSYWDELYSIEEQSVYDSKKTKSHTEEFIHNKYPMRLKYDVNVDAKVSMDGFQTRTLKNFLKSFSYIPKNRKVEFFFKGTNTPKPYDIYWKVRNVGEEAYRKNKIRGQITYKNRKKLTEPTSFKGPHFVECYIVKDGICVARTRVDVPI